MKLFHFSILSNKMTNLFLLLQKYAVFKALTISTSFVNINHLNYINNEKILFKLIKLPSAAKEKLNPKLKN